MKLAKNFYLSEFTKSETAERLGLYNHPIEQHLENMKLVAENILQPVRDYVNRPVIITSGYRSPQLNVAIGGSINSQHCKGEAADFEVPGISNRKLANWIAENLKYDQLILEFYNPKEGNNSGWIHCSYTKWNRRKEKLVAFKDGRKTIYQKVDDFEQSTLDSLLNSL